jgi:predicted ATPase
MEDMFARFRVSNFMCLGSVDVELGPLTIFIGPNSSGKSAFFKAINNFCRLLWYPVRYGPTGDFHVESGVDFDDVVWKRDSSLPIRFEVWLDANSTPDPDYTLELRRDFKGWNIAREKFLFNGQWVDTGKQPIFIDTIAGKRQFGLGSPEAYIAPIAYQTQRYTRDGIAAPQVAPIQELRARMGRARRYRPSAIDIASFVGEKSGKIPKPMAEVSETGRGLPLELQEFLGGERDRFLLMEAEIHKVHGHVLGLSLRHDYRGLGLFYRTTRFPQELPASLESDGVLLTTFMAWRVYTAGDLKVCIEEPENGVHIANLEKRYELFRRAANGELSDPQKATKPQILIATHSKNFLDAIPDHTSILKEVRVVENLSSGKTVIHKLEDYKKISDLLKESKGKMGDLWWTMSQNQSWDWKE